jgi:hypothetical protein
VLAGASSSLSAPKSASQEAKNRELNFKKIGRRFFETFLRSAVRSLHVAIFAVDNG